MGAGNTKALQKDPIQYHHLHLTPKHTKNQDLGAQFSLKAIH